MDYTESALMGVLMDMGLSKSQTTNKTVTQLIDAIAADNGLPVKLMTARWADLQDAVKNLAWKYEGKMLKYERITERGEQLLESMKDVSASSAGIASERARDALILWSRMLDVAKAHDVDIDHASTSISYIMYAVFSGQGAITAEKPEDEETGAKVKSTPRKRL